METIREPEPPLPVPTPNHKRKRGLDPHWDHLRNYSSKALLDCIETLKDEFKARGVILVVTTEPRRDNNHGG